MSQPHLSRECEAPYIYRDGLAYRCMGHTVDGAHLWERNPEADIIHTSYDPPWAYRDYWTGIMVGMWAGALIVVLIHIITERAI